MFRIMSITPRWMLFGITVLCCLCLVHITVLLVWDLSPVSIPMSTYVPYSKKHLDYHGYWDNFKTMTINTEPTGEQFASHSCTHDPMKNTTSILVINGASFLGYHLSKSLLTNGHKVIILDQIYTSTISTHEILVKEERIRSLRNHPNNTYFTLLEHDHCDVQFIVDSIRWFTPSYVYYIEDSVFDMRILSSKVSCFITLMEATFNIRVKLILHNTHLCTTEKENSDHHTTCNQHHLINFSLKSAAHVYKSMYNIPISVIQVPYLYGSFYNQNDHIYYTINKITTDRIADNAIEPLLIYRSAIETINLIVKLQQYRCISLIYTIEPTQSQLMLHDILITLDEKSTLLLDQQTDKQYLLGGTNIAGYHGIDADDALEAVAWYRYICGKFYERLGNSKRTDSSVQNTQSVNAPLVLTSEVVPDGDKVLAHGRTDNYISSLVISSSLINDKLNSISQRHNYVFTSYYTSAIDPQRISHVRSNNYEYFNTWYSSIRDQHVNAVIFHDQIDLLLDTTLVDEHVKFIYNNLKGRSTNDYRFYAYLDYLKSNPHIDNVVLSDGSDVVFLTDVFSVMSNIGDRLFICKDKDVAGSTYNWYIDRETRCRYKDNTRPENSSISLVFPPNGTVFNAGVIGGSRIMIIKFLTELVEILDRTPPNRNCNMYAVNKAIKTHFSDIVHAGFPFTGNFKGYPINPKGVAIKHK